MDQNDLFCAHCHRRNAVSATHCAYCGVPLIAGISKNIRTTQGMLIPDKAAPKESAACDELAPELPKGSIAFLGSDAGPLTIESVKSITIGRGESDLPGEFVDMSYFGDMAQAISRSHARITYSDGVFSLEDLNSTNGTWLNHQRLPPGVPYPVDNGDRLWLGPLKLTICLGQKESAEVADRPFIRIPVSDTLMLTSDIFLQLRQTTGSSSRRLTPGVLTYQIAPYLQGIAALQQVLHTWRRQPVPDLRIRSIHSEGAIIVIRLSQAIETVDMLYRHVGPWQDDQWRDSTLDEKQQTNLLQHNLTHLALAMVHDLVPNLAENETPSYLKRLLPALRPLALSRLALMPPTALGMTTTLDPRHTT